MSPTTPNDLSHVVEQLRHRDAYDHPVDRVKVLQTHISYVLLAGDYAYKLKKPVDFGFLDFRTLEQRKHFCLSEVALNSRLSPEMYLGVEPIVRRGSRLHLGGEGEVVEYAVKMQRLPSEQMLDARIAAGRVSTADIERLARMMERFHRAAPSGPSVSRFGVPAEIARDWAENFDQSRPFIGTTHSAAQHRLCLEFVRSSLVRLHSLFLARMRQHRIREGHGDLRTSAVCFDAMCPDGICVFDCIEFNRRFRCCDVASEIAFLAMDLELHERPDLSDAFVDTYVEASGDPGVRRLLPFYGCYRAYVRGKVDGFRLDQSESSPHERAEALLQSRKAFELACGYADEDRPPLLVLMSGLSATGKTTVAQALARLRVFDVLSSDRIRRELAGLTSNARHVTAYGAGLYSKERRQRVYQELHRRAAEALADGRSVILDATHGERAQREEAASLAREHGAYFFVIECRADESAVRQRMDARERVHSVSDARFDTYLQQLSHFEPLDELDDWSHIIVDTSASLDVSTARALHALDERLTPRGLAPGPRIDTARRREALGLRG
ncbi:AAA family ATPase [Myxococcaceae bacterium JPH2]|nr:AAA family ATPase [Myxococcaceae bacterium JPH2]